MSRPAALLTPVLLALSLGLAACSPTGAPDPGTLSGSSGSFGDIDPKGPGTEGADAGNVGETAAGSNPSGALDADGFVIPGQVVQLQLGDSVAYYSYPKLSQEDVQRVTIHSVEYIEKSDLPASAPHDRFNTGVMVISLSWESVMGRVQSNQGYLEAESASGERGIPLAFRDDRLRNGRVPDGETQTGTFTIALDRGPTTLTLLDYTDVPVAQLRIDTSR